MTTPTPETDAIVHPFYGMDVSTEEASALLDHARKLERERDEAREDAKQGWKQAEEYRGLIPTTAQAMVYHSLLMKYKASEAEITKLRKVCDAAVAAMRNHAGWIKRAGIDGKELPMLRHCDVALVEIDYSTLPHVMLKKGTSK